MIARSLAVDRDPERHKHIVDKVGDREFAAPVAGEEQPHRVGISVVGDQT